MKQKLWFLLILCVCIGFALSAQEKAPKDSDHKCAAHESADRLAVLWTSGDADVAKKMVFIYTYNAKKQNWFKEVRFIVWGPSAKLLSQDKELQGWIGKLKTVGVGIFACKWCSDSYGVSDQLAALGIEVIYYGKPLTELLKTGWKVLTF